MKPSKYIRRLDDRQHPAVPNTDDSPSKELWLEQGWQDYDLEKERLSDLMFDPNEERNLVNSPAYTTVLAELRGRLDRWMIKTNDPLRAT